MKPQVNRDFSRRSVSVTARHAPDPRAALAAQFIPAGARVLDLSVAADLQRLLPGGCGYRAADAGGDFPAKAAAQSDLIVMLGTLECIVDLESFFAHLRFCRQDVILSYRARDLAGGDRLSFYELARLFDRYGFRISCTAPIDGDETLMRLTPAERLKPLAPCSVAVIAQGDGFGGRLGLQMIQSLLPGEAELHHMSFDRLNEAREAYDLIVLGAGAGLLQPLLSDQVIEVLRRGKAAIGIFGTQYRELIPRAALERLVQRLDYWFARYEDDLLIYGRSHSNAVHLGDWLIDRFPLVRPSEVAPLDIGADFGDDIALDRAIAGIQRHRQVLSAQPQAFLCALTSAELAAFVDAPSPAMAGAVSGSFRSLLIDVFGRSYPERQYFLVDRDAVARYKARVHANVALVRRRIEAALRDVAVAMV